MSAALFGSAGQGIEQAAHGPEPLATVARVANLVLLVCALALVCYMGWVVWRGERE